MDLRFVAMITGCMLIGAGGGAYPPPAQPRFHGSNPYAPYGYGPYRR